MIPAYNEEATIGEVIGTIPRQIEGISKVEVLVVDDGSADKTVEVARDAGADEIVSHTGNKGVGAAFSTGIDNALRMRADIIVNIDADGQFNARDIPRLIEPVLKNRADIAVCSRFLGEDSEPEMPFAKRFGNRVFTRLVSLLARQRFTDTQCGFRAYSRDTALRLVLFGGFTYTQEVFLEACRKGLKIVEVPIRVKYSDVRSSRVVRNPFSYAIRALMIIMRTVRDYTPLKFFGVIGVLVSLCGLVSGSYILLHWLRTGLVSPHIPLAILTGVFLTVGFQLVILALIADMVGRNRRILEDAFYLIKRENYGGKNADR